MSLDNGMTLVTCVVESNPGQMTDPFLRLFSYKGDRLSLSFHTESFPPYSTPSVDCAWLHYAKAPMMDMPIASGEIC